jgi:ethanolamine utilization protein EutA
MNDIVQLVGLDFGTTTSSAVIAEARLCRNAVTGRGDLTDVRECFRSEMVFTPLVDERIDEAAVAQQLDRWLGAGGVRPGDIFGGGALLTGLTAQRDNAAALVRLIRQRLGDALVATADDPCLESWLAFMGSCAELSRANPDLRVLNLDIGGGTTNLALGQAGEVLRTGCLFVGARHVQVEPGAYRLLRLSRYATALFAHLGINKSIGEEMTEAEVNAILSYYLDLLQGAISGQRDRFDEPTARLHEQIPFRPLAGTQPTALTISGGVGKLVYAHLDGKAWPTTTAFGDLGIDLARRLVHSRWGDDLRRIRPASAGRATVYGLLRHSTEVSGSTLYLPDPHMLPLADLPILGTISAATSDDDLRERIALAARSERGACLRVVLRGIRFQSCGEPSEAGDPTRLESYATENVRVLGERIAVALQSASFPANRALVFLVRENVGKVLGQYATRWGALKVKLMVIDEIPTRNAQFARIGAPRQQVVPVSFFGLNEPGEKS